MADDYMWAGFLQVSLAEMFDVKVVVPSASAGIPTFAYHFDWSRYCCLPVHRNALGFGGAQERKDDA